MDTGVRPTGEVVAGGRPLAPGEADGLGILHADLDAFYASVEVQKDPSLRGRPLLVGGTGGRGVVTSASYEARAFGCRNAMPMARARRLCPQAVAVPPDFAAYRRWSPVVLRIFSSVTPLVEPLALDEAFLDVRGARALFGDAVAVARLLRARVREEAGLALTVGVAATKFMAKLASTRGKPDGLLVVPPGRALQFLGPRRPRGGAVRGAQVGRLRGDLRRRHRRPGRPRPGGAALLRAGGPAAPGGRPGRPHRHPEAPLRRLPDHHPGPHFVFECHHGHRAARGRGRAAGPAPARPGPGAAGRGHGQQPAAGRRPGAAAPRARAARLGGGGAGRRRGPGPLRRRRHRPRLAGRRGPGRGLRRGPPDAPAPPRAPPAARPRTVG